MQVSVPHPNLVPRQEGRDHTLSELSTVVQGLARTTTNTPAVCKVGPPGLPTVEQSHTNKHSLHRKTLSAHAAVRCCLPLLPGHADGTAQRGTAHHPPGASIQWGVRSMTHQRPAGGSVRLLNTSSSSLPIRRNSPDSPTVGAQSALPPSKDASRGQ